MPQKQHVIHGRDHTANGSDPIPGIGAGGALEWEDVGTGGGAPAAVAARFVSAYHSSSGVTSGAEYAVPFAFDACVSNDDPADASYGVAYGGYVSGSTWAGDHFTAPDAAGEAFHVKPSPGGVYLIAASMYLPPSSTISVTVRVALPWGSAAQGFGTMTTINAHEYQEAVTFGAAGNARAWVRSWLCVMNEPAGSPQPCGLYVTQTTGSTITAGPPQFCMAAYRI